MANEFIKEASYKVGKSLTLSEADKYWQNESFKFIKTDLKKYILLIVRKLLLFVHPIEITTNAWFDTKLSRFPFYNFIFPLGICGIIISFKQWKKYLLLYFFILTYLISAVLFFVISEYRFPIIPIIIIFASFMVSYLYENSIINNYRKVSIYLILIIILFSIQRIIIKKMNIYNSSYIEHYNKAYIYVKEKMFDKAINEYRLSVKNKPDYWDAWQGLGMVYIIIGKYDESIVSLKKALEIQPKNKETIYYLKIANKMNR